MKKKPAIFIAASGQNEGKTTSCLGIISGLLKRFDRVGFIKPVGQEYITLENQVKIDKDVLLFKEQFQLPYDYTIMSPVIFDHGYTRKCIDGLVSPISLKNSIVDAYHELESQSDCIVVEGTGHVGVGSIIEISNAEVAHLLGLNVVLVTSAGIGSTYDTIMLNKALCDVHGVKISGIILNRILESKHQTTVAYVSKALAKIGLSVIADIPYDDFLTTCCMRDFSSLFAMPILSGEINQLRHFHKTRLVATAVETYQKLIQNKQLIITPSTREDIIITTLKAYWDKKIQHPESEFETGFIFTGSTPPSEYIVEQLRKANVPALYSKMSSFNAMKKISRFTAKLRIEDQEKVLEAISIMEKRINFDALIQMM